LPQINFCPEKGKERKNQQEQNPSFRTVAVLKQRRKVDSIHRPPYEKEFFVQQYKKGEKNR